jgi:hypothetical protein
MQSINQAFYQAFHNDYVSPERLKLFAKNHPYTAEGISIALSNCIEGGVGYLYGRLANVSTASCAKIVVVSNMIRQIILSIISFNTDWKNPKALDNYRFTNSIISGSIAGLTIPYLYDSNLIGPMNLSH